MKFSHLVYAVVLFALLVLDSVAFAAVESPENCLYCNMNRDKYAHSRMLIDYDDGTSVGFCSLHCAAIDLSSKLDKSPLMIKVGDFGSKKLINAEVAFWVIGGAQGGVMTARPKWAFENKEDAEKFIASNGGAIASFEDAIKATYEDMYKDTRMIREKRRMKRMQPQTVTPTLPK